MSSPFLTWVAQCPWVKSRNYCFWYVIYVYIHAPGPTPSLTEPGSPPVCGSMGPWWAEPECWWAKCSLSPQSREPGLNDHLWTKTSLRLKICFSTSVKKKKLDKLFLKSKAMTKSHCNKKLAGFTCFSWRPSSSNTIVFAKTIIRREYSLITGCGYSKKEHSLQIL